MIYFDVGANFGKVSIPIAQSNPEATIYAFEPVPELGSAIAAATSGLPNYILTRAAVSNYNGASTFNVSAHASWGCSSLLDLSEKAHTEWNGRRDMDVTHKMVS